MQHLPGGRVPERSGTRPPGKDIQRHAKKKNWRPLCMANKRRRLEGGKQQLEREAAGRGNDSMTSWPSKTMVRSF
ncbi:hypothetical protein NDU88_005136 [Pleurodeles waltl]|uniref:Uncharacterized protein n=1 Tax=Pleurodeles waltl TaxID=8319 RepID=A0AAV7PI07_PLEWA|nr:hypothetical protein NDU88_005136 [Pleurodeles waltl]